MPEHPVDVNANELGASVAFRLVISLICAVLVNALLLVLIEQLVSGARSVISELEDVHIVEFVRFKPEKKPREIAPTKEKLEEPKPPEKPLESLDIKPTKVRPKPPPLPVPNVRLDLPSRITGGPYLGDVQGTSAPESLDAGDPTVQIPPVYPPRARRAGIEGSVLVEFTIAKDGSVKDPEIVKAEPSRIFERAVLRAIRRWKFSPRFVDGEAVEQRAQKEIIFKLETR